MARRSRLPILAILALFLLGGFALADPLPEGGAAPSAPDAAAPPGPASQAPPVGDRSDVPPVAPKESPPADQQKPPPDANAALPKNVEAVSPSQAFAVLGKKVRGPDGKDVLGSIIDILIDDQGRPRAAIVDFGGFLGVGSRKIAVDWQLMKFRPTDPAAQIVLDLDRGQIQAAPEYKDPTQTAKVVEPAPAAETPAADPPTPDATPAPAPPPVDAASQPDAEKHPH